MILAHDRSWLFVRNPKAASTSIVWSTKALGKRFGPKHGNAYQGTDPATVPIRAVIVRNPWDRMASAYAYKGQGQTFEQFIDGPPWWVTQGVDIKRTPQSYWLEGCNLVIRFENIEEEAGAFLSQIGARRLRHHNATERTHYRDYYTERTKRIVAERFAPDIERFAYTF